MPSRCVAKSAALLAGLALALGATLALDPPPLLVWNVSNSAPRGLYAVRSWGAIARGDMVLAWAPAQERALAASRGYLPRNIPLIKRVAAGPGERICASDGAIFVDDDRVALRLVADRQGRPLPAWQGCHRLRTDEFLLLMPHAASFDGRYFGPSARGAVIGKVTPLWVG